MKSFNSIVFLLSFTMVGTVFSMEEEVPANFGKWFVEFDNKINNKPIEYYTGNNIRYYNEYHAQHDDNNIVSFPVKCTDPLPIEHCGDTRFFVTSATYPGSFSEPGEALAILNSEIKQLAVVRCAAQSNGYKAHVYLGLDTDNFKSVGYKGRDRIYPSRIMALQTRTDHYLGYSGYRSYSASNEVVHFGAMQIGQEVKKHFPQENAGWKSPVFQEQVKELLGERAKDFDFTRQCLSAQKNYWTQEENKLKGITYHSAKK